MNEWLFSFLPKEVGSENLEEQAEFHNHIVIGREKTCHSRDAQLDSHRSAPTLTDKLMEGRGRGSVVEYFHGQALGWLDL